MKLVKWEKDWADEFDMTGFELMSDEKYAKFERSLKVIEYPTEACFGSNESYEFERADDITSGITAMDITEEEGQTIRKLFHKFDKYTSFGWTPVDSIIDDATDQQE